MAKFEKGKSGNPNGRPKGTRNATTVLLERLLEENAGDLINKAIELAKAGDAPALRLCIDRLTPARRDRHIEFDMPDIESPADAVKALGAITKAVAGGEITPSEGTELSKLIENFASTLQVATFAERLEKLEEMMARNGTTK